MIRHRFRCPICKTGVTTDGENFPFCSERCRLLDLGQWFGEGYKVSRPLSPLQRLELEEAGDFATLSSDQDE